MDEIKFQSPPKPTMTPPNARTLLEDRPAELTSLNHALESFRHSYPHTKLALSIFHAILQNVYVYCQSHPNALPAEDYQRHIHDPWQAALEAFRNRHTDLYSGPESLQVAQLMAKQDPVRIWCELDTQVRQNILGGSLADYVSELGEWYMRVRRGSKWLVECAILGLSKMSLDPHDKAIAVANLKAVEICGSKYGAAEKSIAASARHEIFGPGGVLWSAMEAFTRDPDDSRGIVSVLEMVTQQALNVAQVFRYSWEIQVRRSVMPPYKWYANGLEEARKKYVLLVQCRDPQARLPCHVRDGLNDIHFINLWDSLWQKAGELSGPGGFNPRYLDFSMYMWAIQQMQLPSSDPRPWMPGNGNVAAMAVQFWKEHWGDNVKGVPKAHPDGFHLPGLSNALYVETYLDSRGARYPFGGWDSRFYGYDNNSDMSDGEEDDVSDMDVNETASVEAYGPSIDPIDVADVATTKPEDQCCTVCMEDHSYSYSDGRTMKLSTCGHLIHYKCIFNWLNETSSNSNLRPECRAQFSEQRRRCDRSSPD